MSDALYAIGELADLGGISRRTVRYYVQEGLLPPPRGLGAAITMAASTSIACCR